MKLHKITWVLLIIGGLNWLLTGLIPGWDLGNYISGTGAMIVYVLVGLSALVELFSHKKICRNCAPNQSQPAAL